MCLRPKLNNIRSSCAKKKSMIDKIRTGALPLQVVSASPLSIMGRPCKKHRAHGACSLLGVLSLSVTGEDSKKRLIVLFKNIDLKF